MNQKFVTLIKHNSTDQRHPNFFSDVFFSKIKVSYSVLWSARGKKIFLKFLLYPVWTKRRLLNLQFFEMVLIKMIWLKFFYEFVGNIDVLIIFMLNWERQLFHIVIQKDHSVLISLVNILITFPYFIKARHLIFCDVGLLRSIIFV